MTSTTDLIEQLRAIVGASHVLNEGDLTAYEQDWRKRSRGKSLAGIMTNNPDAATLAGHCLFVTAFAQPAFAAALVFGGCLRGAGDTIAPMIINVASTLGVRLTGVILATLILGHGLVAVWVVLGGELTLRGGLFFLRFLQGRWRTVKV